MCGKPYTHKPFDPRARLHHTRYTRFEIYFLRPFFFGFTFTIEWIAGRLKERLQTAFLCVCDAVGKRFVLRLCKYMPSEIISYPT